MTEVEQLRKENQELREKVASFESKLEEALAWNAQLRQAMYGRKSEKLRVLQTDEKEISLFDEAEKEAKAGEPEPDVSGTVVKAHTRKPKRNRDELLKALPREEEILDLPEAERPCDRHPGPPLARHSPPTTSPPRWPPHPAWSKRHGRRAVAASPSSTLTRCPSNCRGLPAPSAAKAP